MKTITRKLKLPDWAKFLAKDVDGVLNAFELAPVPSSGYWYAPDGECEKVCNGMSTHNWERTLERL